MPKPWRCADQLTDLTVAMTQLAKDLQADNGPWRELEAGNRALFGTPLPLIWRPGNPALAPFDSRRFRFFLHGAWRHFMPDRNLSPAHCGFVAVASRAAVFFSAVCSSCSQIRTFPTQTCAEEFYSFSS